MPKNMKSLLVIAQLLAIFIFSFNLFAADWEWQNPFPQANIFNDVWGTSGNDVFAVGEYGTIFHYDGSTWKQMISGTSVHLHGVWGTSANNVFVVGGDSLTYGTGIILHYDGNTWTKMLNGISDTLRSVWGSSANNVFAVGHNGKIFHYDGNTWKEMISGVSYGLLDIWGSSSNNIFVVGGDGYNTADRILHYDGNSWKEIRVGSIGFLRSICGRSANDIFAVGYGGKILHYDGTAWEEIKRLSSEFVHGVWTTSDMDVFVAAGNTIFHYDGIHWEEMPSSISANFNGIWGTSNSELFALGYGGTIIYYDGNNWSKMLPTKGDSNSLSGIWGTDNDNAFAVGYRGTILRYDGSNWTKMESPTYSSLQDIWGSSANDVFVSGGEGVILHYDGRNWSEMTRNPSILLGGIWGSSASKIFAVGSNYLYSSTDQSYGTIMHYDGNTWTEITGDISGSLYDIWGSSGNDIFVVGGETDPVTDESHSIILHYDGNTWSEMTSPVSEYLFGVWGSSANDVFAVGYHNTIIHYDGNTWTEMERPYIHYWIDKVWGSSANDVFVVCNSGLIAHYDGENWTKMESGTGNSLHGIWGSSGNDVFVVGNGGTILHYPSSSNEPDLNRGLVAYYPFNGNANDESGNGNHGIIHGVTLDEGIDGNPNTAYRFSDDQDTNQPSPSYIQIPDSPALRPAYALTISIWIKAASLNSNRGYHIIAKEYESGSKDSYVLFLYQNVMNFGISNQNSHSGVGTAISNLNEWRHITGVWDGISLQLYIDGNKKKSAPFSGPAVYDNNPVFIGADDNDGDGIPEEGWNGVIDEVRIYSRILSETEIQMLYQEGGQSGDTLAANFTAAPTSGIAPLTVQFTDQSSGNPSSWQWDFDGDGTTDATAKNPPAWTYQTPGTYTVSLTAGNGTDTDTKTRTDYITVREASEITESYYGKILSVSPQNSDGTQNIQITGQAVDSTTEQPLAEVPLNLVVSLNGFEKTSKVFTDSTGNFHSTYFPKATEFGTYEVRAVHPDSSDKISQRTFVISRVVIDPGVINLNIPRNYEKTLSIKLESGGTDLHNLRLGYDTLPQGIHVSAGSPVASLASGQSAEMDFTLWADNLSYDKEKLVLYVRSDDKTEYWGTVTVNIQFSEAEPVLFVTPDHLETGLALNETVTESLVLENKGLMGLNDIQLSLVKKDGTPAPDWVHLNCDANQGTLEVGETREIGVSFTSNASQVSEGMYEFYLRLESANYPRTDILLFVSVSQSGKGDAAFKVEDIYTGTTDPKTGEKIQGLAGAKIRVQNEKILTIDETKTTDTKGAVSFADLPAGRYKYRVTAENHQEHIGRLWIRPGVTAEENVFLGYNLVTVEWEVVETSIQDVYDIVLSATYETDVPAPVVVAEPSSLKIPDNIQPGDVMTGEITYTNYGLIRADNLQFSFPQDDEYFKYEFLINRLPDSLGAKEFITVPYRITCTQSFPVQTGGKRKNARQGDCFSFAQCWLLYFDFWCENGQLYADSASVCMGWGYGHCPWTPWGRGGTTGAGGGGGRTYEAISGTICPPDDPCPDDDPCCRLQNGSSEAVESEIDLFTGKYRDDATDLSVKVPGYLLEVKRSYYNHDWHFNDLKEHIELVYGNEAIPKYIKKHGVSYKKADEDGTVYEYDETRHIFREEDGYRWKDGSGNWKRYDAKGKILSYGNRNNQKVSYIYDAQGRIAGLADNSGDQVIWYEYSGNTIMAVKDAHGRRVTYQYSSHDLAKVTNHLGHEWHYDYNLWGGMVSKTDPEGHTTKISYGYQAGGYVESVEFDDGTSKFFDYSYDSGTKERYASVTYSSGKIKELWFNKDGKKIRTDINGRTVETIIYEGRNEIHIDANGNETWREFDQWHNLKREVYPDDSSVVYQYDAKFGNKLRITDERGVVTKYEYDGAGNRIKKIEAYQTDDERITEYTYDEAGNLITEKILGDVRTADALTTMDYDDKGNMISVTDPEGNITTYTYNVMGQVLTQTDPRGNVWTYDYDDAGNLKSVTDPLNHVTQYFYDAAGNKIQETDPEGNITLYEYDYAGRLKKTTDALNNSVFFEYNDEGNLVKRTDPEGNEIRQEYDADGRLAKTVDGNGNEIAYEYQDTPGSSCQTCSGGAGTDQPSKIVYPTFAKTFQYDKRGRKLTETDVLSETEQYLTGFGYDSAGNLISETDKENHVTSYTYDRLGRKISATDAVNGVTEYVYDDRNNLFSLKDANGNITWFEYDRNNRLTKEIRPMGEETRYEYDAAGNLIRKTDARNQKTEYAYNDAGRMTEIRYYAASDASAPEKTVRFAYYPGGTLKSYSDGTTSASYEYDELRQKISETVNYGAFELNFSYTYYKNGLKRSFTGPEGITCEYTYDSNNQLTGISVPGKGTVGFNAYQWNKPAEITFPGGVTREYSYDPLMRIKSLTVKDPTEKTLMDYRYAYDKMNNILSKQTEHGGYAYGYDSIYRLKTADNAILSDEAYTYDKVGNRLTANGGSGNWAYNENNELLGYDGYTLEYDANGNMVRKAGNGEVVVYVYNTENRLTRVEKGDGSVVAEYYYDPFGRRLRKDAGGAKTFFVYADEGLVGEYDENGAVIKTYGYKPNSVWTTDPVFMKQGNEYYFYQNDHLGTPVQMTDGNGDVVWAVRYDAFGEAEVESSSIVVNNLRFPGQYYDGETENHYNWQRYYDIIIGKFLQNDPIKDSINLYEYAKNNPLTYMDPYGMSPSIWDKLSKIPSLINEISELLPNSNNDNSQSVNQTVVINPPSNSCQLGKIERQTSFVRCAHGTVECTITQRCVMFNGITYWETSKNNCTASLCIDDCVRKPQP